MQVVNLPITMLDSELEPPRFAHQGDAGLDLRSAIDIVIEPGCRALVPTGVAVAIPEAHAGLVVPRSGLAAKHGISIVNAPGLIDSGYRGEIKVILINTDASEAFSIQRGDRIAQLVVIAVPPIELAYVDELSSSQRGAQGFGSSGVS